jgi:hypothetical protein
MDKNNSNQSLVPRLFGSCERHCEVGSSLSNRQGCFVGHEPNRTMTFILFEEVQYF